MNSTDIEAKIIELSDAHDWEGTEPDFLIVLAQHFYSQGQRDLANDLYAAMAMAGWSLNVVVWLREKGLLA